MAGPGSEEHREQARRAQRLSEHAREQAGGERAAAERSERLIDTAVDPGLADIHRQAAALHRQAQQQYEQAADVQRLHAEHERRAAQHAEAIENPGPDPDVRDAAADRRDAVADERERLADRREHTADMREEHADDRERSEVERQRQLDEAAGHWAPPEREQLARAKAALRRVGARLARQAEDLDLADARASRDQTTIERESTPPEHDQGSSGSPPTDEPTQGTG